MYNQACVPLRKKYPSHFFACKYLKRLVIFWCAKCDTSFWDFKLRSFPGFWVLRYAWHSVTTCGPGPFSLTIQP